MKALSLTPPWSEMILYHSKKIENREKWKGCSYRGPILLHAAKGIGTRLGFDNRVIQMRQDMAVDCEALGYVISDRKKGYCYAPSATMLRAGIVGRARIDGVIREERDFAAYASNVSGGEEQRRWWFGGFALVLADVEPLPFVPVRGELGFFNVEYPFHQFGIQP